MHNKSFTKCPKCERTLFELVEDAPTHSNYKFFYLRCSSCHTFLGVLPYLDISTQIEKLAKALNVKL